MCVCVFALSVGKGSLVPVLLCYVISKCVVLCCVLCHDLLQCIALYCIALYCIALCTVLCTMW